MANSERMTGSASLGTTQQINIVAAGWAASATLVAIFVLCLIAALLYPTAPLAHTWVKLFSVAPMDSALVWIEGVIGSIAFAWLAAVVGGLTYNRFAR